ncbi:hypothetical protein M413DRAFT_27918 [Hebeloma cylindrosporum]|uniref:Uncharacterized protein n=1 Tax=Hebeloma cylindrosporum TaxID=76867 RepID=A0A0C2XVG1_HEBCY|nr:hypothetical protein M413DRAFT_27918 [Hebeloma cylindrosporum h7]
MVIEGLPTSGWVKVLIAAQHTACQSLLELLMQSTLPLESAQIPSYTLREKYLAAKQAWDLERDDMIKNTEGEDLDALTRRLAHITAIRESQSASKYADAVVCAYSHVFRQYMGYMDLKTLKTLAEALRDAKDALRESAMSSLDGSVKIYPVQMLLVDWFQGLSDSQLDDKFRQFDDLNARLALIQSNPKQCIQELEAKLDAAQEAYDKASSDLSTTYNSNVISLARTCTPTMSFSDFEESAKAAKTATAAFANIEQGMKKLRDTQVAVIRSPRALTQLMAAKSLAEASDTAQEIVKLQVQMTAMQRDITELTTRLQTLRYQSTLPQFFKQSSAFHSIDRSFSWPNWPASTKTFQDLINNQDQSIFDGLNKGLLPAFPTGFIVSKGISIRIRTQDTDIKSAGAEMEKVAASSAGILCRSSASDYSKSSNKSYPFLQKADGCVIRVPGPQVFDSHLFYCDCSSFADKLAAHAVDPTAAIANAAVLN